MRWINFFHIYQPPEWNADIIRRVCDESYRPMLEIMRRHPKIKITLHISGSLTEQLVALGLDDVLTTIKDLLGRGQIELLGGAMYHPILPLLPEPEIRRQIMLQHELHTRAFGAAYRPRGFYPPEMAYGDILEPILRDLGYEWVLVDEAVTGMIGTASFERRYSTPGGLGLVFRNRHLSDYLSFRANVSRSEEALQTLRSDSRSGEHLITAMDGENLGHHRHGVDRLWEILVTDKHVSTETVSVYRSSLITEASLSPVAASWSSQPRELRYHIPYGLWNHPDNPIHKLQWELTYYIINAIENAKSDPQYDAARLLLDQVLTSDKYWWASASPWWDMPIVIRETQRLADVIRPLKTLDPNIRNAVARLMEQISATTELWDRTGLAKKRQATYLEDTGDVRYMGGAKL